MLEINKILFPVDFTENSAKILPYVLSVSEKYNSMICLIHVVEDLAKWVLGIHVPHANLDSCQKDASAWAEQTMDKICKEQLQNCPNFHRIIVFVNTRFRSCQRIRTAGLNHSGFTFCIGQEIH